MKKWSNVLKIIIGATLTPIVLGAIVGGIVILINLIMGNSFDIAMQNLQVIIDNIAPFIPIVTIATLGVCILPLVLKNKSRADMNFKMDKHLTEKDIVITSNEKSKEGFEKINTK